MSRKVYTKPMRSALRGPPPLRRGMAQEIPRKRRCPIRVSTFPRAAHDPRSRREARDHSGGHMDVGRSAVPLVAALFLCSLPPAAIAESLPEGVESRGTLKKMSIEELFNVEVTTVSTKPEPLSSTPAAVKVVTGDDIRRMGALSIPEALRYIPGVEVARVDNRQYAITARGFNGTVANKLLVLIDGRSVYTPLFSGVFWDAQDTLMEDIARIEVIRGPGATLWGANAVNGVINVITKSAEETQGLLLSGGGGGEERGFGGANALGRWTHRISDRSNFQIQTYVDRTHRNIPGTFGDDLATYDLDLQHRFPLGERQEILWGIGYRLTRDDVDNSLTLAFLPP